jgi:hypothetical protein
MNPFEIKPYEGAGSVRFGMTAPEVTSALGEPRRKGANRKGEPDWSYGDYSIRFSKAEGALVEIGFLKSATVLFEGIDVFRDPDCFARIVARDRDVFEFYGFLVFFGLGITLTGFHDNDEAQKALTVFQRGRWDQFKDDPAFKPWRNLKTK